MLYKNMSDSNFEVMNVQYIKTVHSEIQGANWLRQSARPAHGPPHHNLNAKSLEKVLQMRQRLSETQQY